MLPQKHYLEIRTLTFITKKHKAVFLSPLSFHVKLVEMDNKNMKMLVSAGQKSAVIIHRIKGGAKGKELSSPCRTNENDEGGRKLRSKRGIAHV